MTKDQLEELFKDICPRCAEGRSKLVYRQPYAEWGHEQQVLTASGGNAVSSTLCMATHLRNKYQDVLNG